MCFENVRQSLERQMLPPQMWGSNIIAEYAHFKEWDELNPYFLVQTNSKCCSHLKCMIIGGGLNFLFILHENSVWVTRATNFSSKIIVVKIVIVFFCTALESAGARAAQRQWQNTLCANSCQVNLSIFGTNLHDFAVIFIFELSISVKLHCSQKPCPSLCATVRQSFGRRSLIFRTGGKVLKSTKLALVWSNWAPQSADTSV